MTEPTNEVLTLNEILVRICNELYAQWMYDMDVLSTGWICWTVFPGIIYICFMAIKWAIITCPLWLPVSLLLQRLNFSLLSVRGKK